jgi:hypothetical protein
MSEETVAIVKSSWAGWRQGLREQMVRDFDDGVDDRIQAWAEAAGSPTLQPLEFIDGDDAILVCAVEVGANRVLWFNYTMDGRRIVGWEAFDDEAKAREAAGLS